MRSHHNEIEVQVQHFDQLFETLDPSPFREKALDPEFETYLRDCVGAFPDDAQVRLLVHAPAPSRQHADDFPLALHAHFDFLLEQHDRRRRMVARRHRGVVIAGVAVLAGSLLLRQWLAGWSGPLVDITAEGLLVLGWVALWRPIDALLFDRHEAREERAVLRRLARVEVEWRPLPST